jgi:hypothetical protein
VRELLGRSARIDTLLETLPVRMFGEPSSFREYFRTNYGPVGAVYRSLGDDEGRRAELDAAIDDLAARFTDSDGLMQWEYLLVTATR